MRIASINLNKGLGGGRRLDFEEWLSRQQVDLLLVQEPVAVGFAPPPSLLDLELLGGNDMVAAYGAAGSGTTQLLEDRWLRVATDSWVLDDVYFPHEGKTAREKFFRRLLDRPAPKRLVVGDFNMAPRPQDGRYGNELSNWTGARERTAFGALLSGGLSDLGEQDPHEFTFQKLNRGKWTRFRCDLALVSTGQRAAVRYWSDPTVRNPTVGFTDHSAVLVEVSR